MKQKATELDTRIKATLKATAVTMVPEFVTPPPPKPEVLVPDIRELIPNPLERSRLIQLIEQSAAWASQEKEAKRQREPITKLIKKVLGDYDIGKAMCGELMVNYYNCPRSTLSKELLLSHGVSPKILDMCTVKKDAYTLRIGLAGDMGSDD